MNIRLTSNTVVTFQEKDSTLEQVGVLVDYIEMCGEQRPRILYKGDLHVMSVRAETIKPTLDLSTLWLGLQELASYYEHSLRPDLLGSASSSCKHCEHPFSADIRDGSQNLYGPFTKVCMPYHDRGDRQ